jgi:hypothetical protein
MWLLTLGIVAGFVILAVGGHGYVWRRTQGEPKPNNEATGHILGVVGVMYAVVLAFVVVVVWENYDRASSNAQREVSMAADLYHAADDWPEPLRATQRKAILDYVDLMISDEWPAMARGSLSPKTRAALQQLRRNIGTFAPQTPLATESRASSIRLLEKFSDARRERMADSERGMPGVLWVALFAGAGVTIGFVYFFRLHHPPMQLAMTGCLALMIGVMFALVAQLEHPFRGPSAIDPGGWQRLAAVLPADDPQRH